MKTNKIKLNTQKNFFNRRFTMISSALKGNLFWSKMIKNFEK
jgi:hypothetical protein